METEQVKLGEKCIQIINDPEKNINKLKEIKAYTVEDGIKYSALAKIFQHISPLYKIRIHSKKVKHKNLEERLTSYDKILFREYNEYIRDICSSHIPESYNCACELLKTLSHFNFSDRLVGKVLIGTTSKNSLVSTICVETLVDLIINDVVGDVVFIILNQCLEYKHSHLVVKAMLESKYLMKCVEIRRSKELKYTEEEIQRKKNEEKYKKGTGFMKPEEIYGHKEKKEEKKRRSQESDTKKKESEEMDPIEDKNYIKTINSVQRVYFTVLKYRHKDCYISCYKGIRKYLILIRKEFYEGLYTLLTDSTADSGDEARIECIFTMVHLYKDYGIDFKKAINILYDVIRPLNFDINSYSYVQIVKIVEDLFITRRQSGKRVKGLLQRMLVCASVRYIPEYKDLFRRVVARYDVEWNDVDMKNKKTDVEEHRDIDMIPEKPYYEYYLWKKISY